MQCRRCGVAAACVACRGTGAGGSLTLGGGGGVPALSGAWPAPGTRAASSGRGPAAAMQACAPACCLVDQLCQGSRRAMDPSSLPIRRHASEIASACKENDIIVVIGETGSGKTTQLSQVRGRTAAMERRRGACHTCFTALQILLEAGLADGGLIGVTQPRRVVSAQFFAWAAILRAPPLRPTAPPHPLVHPPPRAPSPWPSAWQRSAALSWARKWGTLCGLRTGAAPRRASSTSQTARCCGSCWRTQCSAAIRCVGVPSAQGMAPPSLPCCALHPAVASWLSRASRGCWVQRRAVCWGAAPAGSGQPAPLQPPGGAAGCPCTR
jgi:hypothetical protein